MKTDNDPVLDVALEEALGWAAAPDLTARILARARQPEPSPPADIHVMPRRRAGRRWFFTGIELLAAAAVLGVVAWLVWFSEKPPATNMQADDDAPTFAGNQHQEKDEARQDPEPSEEPEKRVKREVYSVDDLIKVPDSVTDLLVSAMRDQDVPLLLRFTRLRHLDISSRDSVPFSPSGNMITDKGLGMLSKLKSLQSINLFKNRHITAAGIARLAELPQLEGLNLSRVKLDGAMLRELARFPALRELDLEGCEFTGEPHEFETMPSLPHLREINLSRCSFVCDKALKWVAQCRNLERLTLPGNAKFADDGVRELARMTQLKSLRAGHMSNRVSSSALVEALGGMHSLQFIDLSSIKGVDDAVLGVIGRMHDLRHLTLYGCCNITDEGVKSLEGLKRLETLDLGLCGGVGDRALETIGVELKALRVLRLSGQISGGGAGGFAGDDEWMNNRYLRVSDAGLAFICRLPNLEELSLRGSNTLTSAGLRRLAGYAENVMGGATPAQFTRLRELDLTDCSGITDEDVEFGLATLPRLSKLYMDGCNQLTDAAAKHFARIKTLTHLNIRFYSHGAGDKRILSSKAERELKEALPNLSIKLK